jgi:hypothetical protein
MTQGRTDDFKPTPGFQGSETTGCEVTIYQQGGDPILLRGDGALPLDGRKPDDENPSIIGVQTSKSLGTAAGQFGVQIKVSTRKEKQINILDNIIDDDWVDIVLTRHGRKWHVMRGLVDEVRQADNVAGSGATSQTYTISGRDFGKVWEATDVWFSLQAKDNVSGHFAQKVFSVTPERENSNVVGDTLVLGTPSAAVRGYMFGFLEELEGVGRANWNPPPTMPAITNGSFIESLFYNNINFLNNPERVAIDPNFAMAGGNLWSLAQQWSDPIFTELYCDLFVGGGQGLGGADQGGQALQGVEAPVEDTVMTVVFRDKPFPLVGNAIDAPTGKDSAWFKLPLFIIPREALVTKDVGRSGMERFNAYFVTTQLAAESLGQAAIDLQAPLWDKDDILRHGLRRFDVQSKYGSKDAEMLNIAEKQREMVRDWYCLNPYHLNGTLELGVLFPDVRIGSRARVPGAVSENDDETYYIESVSHNWAYGKGGRTSLGVTRGWRGTEDSLIEALETLRDRYALEDSAQPGE